VRVHKVGTFHLPRVLTRGLLNLAMFRRLFAVNAEGIDSEKAGEFITSI